MSFNRKEQRSHRHLRLRQRVKGTAERPRMAIYFSNKHMYVQFIDDVVGRTLAVIRADFHIRVGRTLAATATGKSVTGSNLATAKQVGALAAEAALAKGLRQVVVDRGGFKFHGRIRQLVEAAVAAGLKITNDAPEAAEVTK